MLKIGDALPPVMPGAVVRLDDTAARPPADAPRREAAEKELHHLTRRMDVLQRRLWAEGRQALLVILQARDAGGKDGTIRRVFGPLDALGVSVTAFRAPSEEEREHDFLWRVHRHVPPLGHVGIFNRSHYEDVLVARVRRLVPEVVWEARYAQINDFERLLGENRVALLKFFLHISKDEQRKRLLARLDDPRKNWKVSPDDYVDRDLWDEYTEAYEAAISRCGPASAPWYVVPADSKPLRNVLVARTVVLTLERMNPQPPTADPALIRELRARLA